MGYVARGATLGLPQARSFVVALESQARHEIEEARACCADANRHEPAALLHKPADLLHKPARGDTPIRRERADNAADVEWDWA